MTRRVACVPPAAHKTAVSDILYWKAPGAGDRTAVKPATGAIFV